MGNRMGSGTIFLPRRPGVLSGAAVVGKLEGEGPLGSSFDEVEEDAYFGEKSWEQAESTMLRRAFRCALQKAAISEKQVDLLFGGDLLNQCISTTFAFRDTGIPLFGLYGACSTMAESLALAALSVDGGYAEVAAAATSSHFCAAERQYRFPLEYGGQRTPTAQWTVTGAGAAIVGRGGRLRVTHITPGRIVDMGITDANHMGAAMAPAACDTVTRHMKDTGRTPSDYDLIVTGDLGIVGGQIFRELMTVEGFRLTGKYHDCGAMIFDPRKQDVHAGGSGCGCSASVLCGHILPEMAAGKWKRVLFAATGALMSPTSTQQKQSIPGICCAVALSGEEDL